MTTQELRERLDDRLVREREDLADSIAVAPNSYGAGYDQGFVDALEQVLNTINGKEDNTL